MQLTFGMSKLGYIWRTLMPVFATSYLKAHEESPIKNEAPPTKKTKETKKKLKPRLIFGLREKCKGKWLAAEYRSSI